MAIILTITCAIFALAIAAPVWAATTTPTTTSTTTSTQNQSWSVGAGYFTLPKINDKSGKLSRSGPYASIAMRSSDYLLEGDYALGDSKFVALAVDYLYSMTASQGAANGTYVGAGYTYFSSTTFKNAKGFNLIAGMNFSSKLNGNIRYDMLNSNHELLTAGISYLF